MKDDGSTFFGQVKCRSCTEIALRCQPTICTTEGFHMFVLPKASTQPQLSLYGTGSTMVIDCFRMSDRSLSCIWISSLTISALTHKPCCDFKLRVRRVLTALFSVLPKISSTVNDVNLRFHPEEIVSSEASLEECGVVGGECIVRIICFNYFH